MSNRKSLALSSGSLRQKMSNPKLPMAANGRAHVLQVKKNKSKRKGLEPTSDAPLQRNFCLRCTGLCNKI